MVLGSIVVAVMTWQLLNIVTFQLMVLGTILMCS